MTDRLIFAQDTLIKENYTLVLWDGARLITSYDRGIKPLLDLYESREGYGDFCAADKVIGKAAAFLYVLLSIREIFAVCVSEGALEVFEKYGVLVTYKELVPFIVNRAKNGMCPMENAVLDIDEPKLAYSAILKKLEELNNKRTTSP